MVCGLEFKRPGLHLRSHDLTTATYFRRYPKELEKLFWSRVERREPQSCWLWLGSRSKAGYGVFCVGARTDEAAIRESAHRMAFQFVKRPLLVGEFVCHHCDNPLCCNPAHLIAADSRWNTADMVRKGRQARGERVSGATLTEPLVVMLRQAIQQGYSSAALSDLFGLSYRAVNQAVREGGTWVHASGPTRPVRRQKRPGRVTPAKIQWIKEMRDSGRKLKEIAKEVDLCFSHVSLIATGNWPRQR